MPTGYATRSLAPQSWQHPEDIELVFNGAKGGLGYSEARCGVSRIRGDAKWSLITVDEPCWTNLKKGYDAEFAGLVPAAPTDVENSLSLLRKRGSWFPIFRRANVLYFLLVAGPRRVTRRPVLERLSSAQERPTPRSTTWHSER